MVSQSPCHDWEHFLPTVEKDVLMQREMERESTDI